MQKERVQIYIDGGNFYYLVLKKLGLHEADFSYDKFAAYLVGDRTLVSQGKRIYMGTVSEKSGDEKSKKSMSKQVQFFTSLQATGWDIKTSKLRNRTERIKIDERVQDYQELKKKGVTEVVVQTKREKGIDVKLAVDVIVGAFDDRYDTAIIVSSDSDLVPALDWVRKRTKKSVEYVGFSIVDKRDERNSTTPLLSMISHTKTQRVLTESDLKDFISIQGKIV